MSNIKGKVRKFMNNIKEKIQGFSLIILVGKLERK